MKRKKKDIPLILVKGQRKKQHKFKPKFWAGEIKEAKGLRKNCVGVEEDMQMSVQQMEDDRFTPLRGIRPAASR